MSETLLKADRLTYSWTSRFQVKEIRRVLNQFSLEVRQGKITGLLGPNGSGKSTLMKVMSGIWPLRSSDCSGEVRYLDQDFFSLSPAERARRVVYVAPDLKTEFPLTACEVVRLGATCRQEGFLSRPSLEEQDRIRWAMEKCLCWDLRNRNFETLSGGERQLVALAKGLVQGGRVLFLDEALARMDLHHQAAIGQVLKDLAKQDWAIVLVSHDVNLALEWVDHLVLMKAGEKIFEGPTQQGIPSEMLKVLYPNVPLVMGQNPSTGALKIFLGS